MVWIDFKIKTTKTINRIERLPSKFNYFHALLSLFINSVRKGNRASNKSEFSFLEKV